MRAILEARSRAGALASLLALALLAGAAGGCRRPGEPARAGTVNLDALARAHPGWSRVRDLDRKIERLAASPARDGAALFSPPPPARLQPVGRAAAGDDTAQRRRLGASIAERVRRDFQAQAAQLERRAERAERVALANAAVAVEDRIATENERFARIYDATAHRYAGTLGRLKLQQLELTPSLLDITFFPQEEIARRARELQSVTAEILTVQRQRDAELAALQAGHRTKVAELRESARVAALASARAEARRQLAELERRQQALQTQVARELERTFRAAAMPALTPAGAVPEERGEIEAKVARLNQAAAAELQAQRQAQAAAVEALRRQRGELVALVEADTRAAARQVAAEDGLRLAFGRSGSDPDLTARVMNRLRQHWAMGGAAVTGGRG